MDEYIQLLDELMALKDEWKKLAGRIKQKESEIDTFVSENPDVAEFICDINRLSLWKQYGFELPKEG